MQQIEPAAGARRTRVLADTPGARNSGTPDTGGAGRGRSCSRIRRPRACAVWGFQQPVLAKAGYRVIAYSRRGFDRSEAGDVRLIAAARSATSWRTVFDALGHRLRRTWSGLRPVAASPCGFAVGASRPRASSLVLAGSILVAGSRRGMAGEVYGRLEHRCGEAASLGGVHRARPLLPRSQPRRARRGIRARSRRRHIATSRAASRRAWTSPSPRWQRRGVPVLILTGEADLYAPPPLQALHARHLPGCETATLREVGHAPYWEAPEAFNRLVLDFLARQRGR